MSRVKLLLAVAIVVFMSGAAYAAPRGAGTAHHKAGHKAVCKSLGGKHSTGATFQHARGGKGLAAHRGSVQRGYGGKGLTAHRGVAGRGHAIKGLAGYRGGGKAGHLGKGMSRFGRGYAMQRGRGGAALRGHFGWSWGRG
jgi:hypothetical protein